LEIHLRTKIFSFAIKESFKSWFLIAPLFWFEHQRSQTKGKNSSKIHSSSLKSFFFPSDFSTLQHHQPCLMSWLDFLSFILLRFHFHAKELLFSPPSSSPPSHHRVVNEYSIWLHGTLLSYFCSTLIKTIFLFALLLCI
jgi:hypothetical protein